MTHIDDNAHDPIGSLKHEHEIITKVLDALGTIAKRLSAQSRVDPQALRHAVRFLQEFVDRCHHVKEERILFPALEGKGLPKSAGPLFVLLGEHEDGRRIIRALDQATQRYAMRKDDARAAIADAISEIVQLYTQHIAKENEVLFPMAERLFSADELHDLFEAFERVEVEGGADHDALAAIALDLEKEARC